MKRKSNKLTVAIAPNSFKGTLSAAQAAACIERGFRKAIPGIRARIIPMADGGDGTVESVVAATRGRMVKRSARDPLGRRVRARFGLTRDGKTAVIEMAAASGLVLLKASERNPLAASTFGTGELIRAALDRNVKNIVVGIGGSATNDGGTGMARALGVRFLDRRGRDLPEGGGPLRDLARIDMSGLDPRVRRARIVAACDVANPLVGPRGAARVYAPQKGATPEDVAVLERGLSTLARIVSRQLGVEIRDMPGAGAAGGLGAGLVAFLNARLRPGADVVMETVGLERRLRGCDLVITGEGRLDGQTIYGKAPIGVARAAGKLGLPVIAICGSVGAGAEKTLTAGIDAYFAVCGGKPGRAAVGKRAASRLVERARQVAGRLSAIERFRNRCYGRTGVRRGKQPKPAQKDQVKSSCRSFTKN